jgi:hypothetical protein
MQVDVLLPTTAIAVATPVNPDITDVTVSQTINCNGDNTGTIIDNTKGVAPFVYNIKQYSDAAHTTLVNDYGTQTLVWLRVIILSLLQMLKDVLILSKGKL